VNYFFDNCISFRFARMLSALDVDAVALRDEFEQGIDDPELFARLAGRELVFVTTDRHQTTRRQEAEALKDCGVPAIFFGPFWARMQFWDQAAWLVTKWPEIDAFCASVAAGTCAEVKQNGTFMVYPG
jgi:hypothetical protein